MVFYHEVYTESERESVGLSSFRSVTVFKKTLKQTWTSKVFLFFYYILLTFILVSCCASFFYVNHALACSKLIKMLVSRYPAAGKCFQKTRYPAVRNFDQFSRNSSFNSSKNIIYLFRNVKRL